MSDSKIVQILTIVAVADTSLLTRVCGILTTLGVLPAQLRSELNPANSNVTIEIGLSAIPAPKLDLLTRKFAQLILVDSVSVRSAVPDLD